MAIDIKIKRCLVIATAEKTEKQYVTHFMAHSSQQSDECNKTSSRQQIVPKHDINHSREMSRHERSPVFAKCIHP